MLSAPEFLKNNENLAFMIGGVGGYLEKQFGQPLFLDVVTNSIEIKTHNSPNLSIMNMENYESDDVATKLVKAN